ncbi:MAG: hypothetical protein NC048_02610 [Bacteroides sp.]|nr:hypothetical protein [Bacteroides sp.]MCM1531469.1 hypothetical protein [Ruminococcus flavefaciens]MCM1554369.1 hypothetical protein [Bacteroides sp.]
MKADIDVLRYLRYWRTPAEIKSRFGIRNPEAYMAQLQADGYGIMKEKRELGVLMVPCFRWNGQWKRPEGGADV